MILKHNQELNKFKNHKDFFGIKDSAFLKEFETLLEDSDDSDYRLECSVKIENNKFFASRFNVYYEDKYHSGNLKKIFSFFDSLTSLGASFDYKLIDSFVNTQLDLNEVQQIICGIDLREKNEDSRAKVYILFKENSTKWINKAINFFDYKDPKFFNLILPSKIMIGFDLGFNSTSKIKIYLPFIQFYLENLAIIKKLENSFSSESFELIKISRQVFISFNQNNSKRILHLLPKNPDEFLQLINNPQMQKLYSFLKDKTHLIISLSEEEIHRKNYTEINVYYGL